MQTLIREKVIIGLILAPLIFQLMGLLVSVFIDSYLTKKHRNTLFFILVLESLLLIQDVTEFNYGIQAEYSFMRVIVSIIGYTIRPMLLIGFIYLCSKKRLFFEWVLIAVNGAVYMTALFSKIAFYFTEQNTFHRGPLGFTCHIISAVLLIELLYLTIKEYGIINLKGVGIPITAATAVVAAVIADSLVGVDMIVSFLTMTVISMTLFFYIWIHLRFVSEHEKNLKAEQRIQIMMSQIQPHFLYNTLSTIQSLCRTNPEKAGEVTENFGIYLRQNLDALSQPNLIPLSKALEHTKVYAEIEMVRFPKIKVEYDIQDENFYIPVLTIQPLVENSIRHGIRGLENGKVTVSTRRTPDYHEIIVKDNGKGFDAKKIKQKDSGHIGLRNVKERIENMCHGTMDIVSNPHDGTTITIRIPAEQL